MGGNRQLDEQRNTALHGKGGVVGDNGTATQNVTVYRNITISNGGKERFTTMAVAQVQTLARVFEIKTDAEPLESVLTFGMYPTSITGSHERDGFSCSVWIKSFQKRSGNTYMA